MLNFDSWQRCETVKHLLNWAMPGGGDVLDVGGYPGRMRTLLPQYNWVLCDPLVDAPGNQVIGSGSNLPFQDSSFDYAISLDVFEHIPEEKRNNVIDEMMRVSRQGLVLSFPHRDPLVEAAEQHVRDAYEHLHKKAHPWLSEHTQQPLPDIDAITEHLKSYGGEVVIFDVGSIRRWAKLQLLDVLLEALPNSLETARELDHWYEENLFIHEFKAPAYRKILMHQFHAEEPIELYMVETSAEEEAQAEMAFQHQVTLKLMQLQRANREKISELEQQCREVDAKLQAEKKKHESAFKKLTEEKSTEKTPKKKPEAQAPEQIKQAEPEAKTEERTTTPEPRIDLADQYEYINRLETGIKLWEDTYKHALQQVAEAQQWRADLEQRRSFKLYKRLMRLLGRKVQT